jgi:hypothetical protein
MLNMIYEDDDEDEEQLQQLKQLNSQVPEVVLELPSDSDSSRCGNSCYCPFYSTGPMYFDFCRLCPFSPQPAWQCFAPTCHLSTFN